MARCDGHYRYPLVESVLGDMSIQPYVHNCSVSILHKNRWSQYIVFFKLHSRLPVNRSVSFVARSHSIRGDVAVMRIGFDGRVVNMRHGDAVTRRDHGFHALPKAEEGPYGAYDRYHGGEVTASVGGSAGEATRGGTGCERLWGMKSGP
ncbi:hypothetical protein TRAPUB_3668 [Trametes pubescens]|uniref:Uncharacterized protein n=1 Tax=Trametes pubescens TaxID=154538 RepID=A0A1M2VD41_TRAPU|nr:hypothetical protein TRAPUB_3668 [Trametes pubescens]